MEELIGQKLGQYHIEAKIGIGGMASVFKAYQPSLERYVALKVQPPSFASKNPIFVKRFEREAKSVARLHHPNILPVYDFGIERDYSYIVMRYWEWQGVVPPDFGFEVRIWREGEPPAGVHAAVLDNREGRVEKIGENRYRLRVDIRQAAGVQERTGEYLWSVALVQISPTYADPGMQAEPARSASL